ncbi:hypothetical protein [Nocardia sp. NPDC049149]|uniref:hypothetical protein n=1 Tax=Nocardia sp. NPDC049149 TaxID=3364315 RepID=UPI00372414EA
MTATMNSETASHRLGNDMEWVQEMATAMVDLPLEQLKILERGLRAPGTRTVRHHRQAVLLAMRAAS